MEQRKQITVKFSKNDADKIAVQALSDGVSLSQFIRDATLEKMEKNSYSNHEKTTLYNMQKAMKQVLEPQVERLAKLNVKTSMAAFVNLLFTSTMIHRITDPAVRDQLEELFEDARRMAVDYVASGKGNLDDFISSSMERLNDKWDEINPRKQ